jgi:hypothetical protein
LRWLRLSRAKVRVAGSNHGNRRLLSGTLNHNGPGYHKRGAFTFAKTEAARLSVNNFDFASPFIPRVCGSVAEPSSSFLLVPVLPLAVLPLVPVLLPLLPVVLPLVPVPLVPLAPVPVPVLLPLLPLPELPPPLD